MPYFSVHSFLEDQRGHFIGHGFHWHDESHTLSLTDLSQCYYVDLHPEEICGTDMDFEVHLQILWPAETQLAIKEWMDSSPPDADFPDSLMLPLEFNFCLPPLDNPPDLLSVWFDVLGRNEHSLLRFDVSGSDNIEAPTEPARRSMTITARCDVPVRDLIAEAEEEDEDDDDAEPQLAMCSILEDLHGLSLYLLENLNQWRAAPEVL